MSLARFALTPRFPSFWRDVDDLFRDMGAAPQPTGPQTFTPAADVVESDKAVEISLDLPGFAPEQIDVKLEGDQLTVTAQRADEPAAGEKQAWLRRERSRGHFVRSFTLPDMLEGTKPQATYRNGVLTLTLPKREEAQPRSFKVKVDA